MPIQARPSATLQIQWYPATASTGDAVPWTYGTYPLISQTTPMSWYPSTGYAPVFDQGTLLSSKVPPGTTLDLPDGSKLIVDDKGNYRVEDKDAKITYQANRIRDFSPYLNASDMVAGFIKFVGSLGLRQSEVLQLPIELFIAWLILEAASRDHDPVPEDVPSNLFFGLEQHRANPLIPLEIVDQVANARLVSCSVEPA